jgi:hypothetical protein
MELPSLLRYSLHDLLLVSGLSMPKTKKLVLVLKGRWRMKEAMAYFEGYHF